jgi:hypothetical protein
LKLLSTTFALAITDTPLAAQHLTLRLLDHLVVTEATHPDLPLRPKSRAIVVQTLAVLYASEPVWSQIASAAPQCGQARGFCECHSPGTRKSWPYSGHSTTALLPLPSMMRAGSNWYIGVPSGWCEQERRLSQGCQLNGRMMTGSASLFCS